MTTRIRFGFILGLLVGTTTVGAVGVMMGQAEARVQPRPQAAARFARYEVTQSPDGSRAYLWGVDAADGKVVFLDSARAPAAHEPDRHDDEPPRSPHTEHGEHGDGGG